MVVTELADQLAEDRPLVREVDVEGPCATLALWVTSTIEARSNPLAPNTSSAASSSCRRVACPRAVTGTAGYSVRPIVPPPLAPAGTVMKAESVANLCGEGGRDRSQAELEPEIGSARCAMADPPARERPRAFWVFDRPLHRDWLFLIGLAAGVAFAGYALARPDRPAALVLAYELFWALPGGVLADGLLALGLGLLSVSSALGARGRGANVPTLGLVLLAALVPALFIRRRLPGTSLAAVAGLQIGVIALGIAPGANFAAELVAPYSVALYGSRRVRLIAAACAGVALIVLALPVSSGWDRGNSLALLVAGAGAWLVGDVMRNRRAGVADLAERTARLERERDLEAARAAAEERLRIARELHDVVAHNLSVVVVQAQAAQRILDRDLERARGVVVSIERTGREALDEMRRLLGVLRAGEPSGDGEAEGDGLFGPQPGLARLGELVGQLHAAGLPVSLRVEGDERPLEAAVDLSAFRIVQEALTNALK